MPETDDGSHAVNAAVSSTTWMRHDPSTTAFATTSAASAMAYSLHTRAITLSSHDAARPEALRAAGGTCAPWGEKGVCLGLSTGATYGRCGVAAYGCWPWYAWPA